MLGGSEATSEQLSSVREDASYNEVYPSGCGLEKGLTWSLERELSAYSLDDEDEEDYEANGGEDGKEVEEEEGGERKGEMRRKRVMKGVTKKVTSWLTRWTEEVVDLLFFQKYGRWTTSTRPCPRGSLIPSRTVIKSPTTSQFVCQVNLRNVIWVKRRM